jgi:hypothetical protein
MARAGDSGKQGAETRCGDGARQNTVRASMVEQSY